MQGIYRSPRHIVRVGLIIITKHFNNEEESKIHTKCYHPGDLLLDSYLWAEAHVVLCKCDLRYVWFKYFFPHLAIYLRDFSLLVHIDLLHSLKININELQFICLIYHRLEGMKAVANFSVL